MKKEEKTLYEGQNDDEQIAAPGDGGEKVTQDPPALTTNPASGYSGYQQSESVRRAQQMLEEYTSRKPGEYQSSWQSQLDEILGKILNREEFSYDLNGDALYQQYKDQYMLLGKQAMMDTMGHAQAMTGGYGNSYAQTAGQQAYQGHLQQLNDRIPELYQLALSKYKMEGDALADQYAMIGAREDQDYARYQDSMEAYYADLDRLTDRYDAERNYDYGKYADERDFAYAQERDKAADEKWQAEFDEAKRRYDQEWEQKYGPTDKGSGGGSGGGGQYNPETAKTQQMLRDAGYDIAVDGIWGPETQEAYDAYYGKDGGEPVLSQNGENFMKNLPYAHGGTDAEVWKKTVEERLERGLNSGSLSESDVMIIIKKLGL